VEPTRLYPRYPKLHRLAGCQNRKSWIQFCQTKDGRQRLSQSIQRHSSLGAIDETSRKILKESLLSKNEKRLPPLFSEQINEIHRVLTNYWSCDCPPPFRKVYLHLPALSEPVVSDNSTTFKLLFSNSDNCEYQAGEVLVGTNDQVIERPKLKAGEKRLDITWFWNSTGACMLSLII
jgi:hypothetical protein